MSIFYNNLCNGHKYAELSVFLAFVKKKKSILPYDTFNTVGNVYEEQLIYVWTSVILLSSGRVAMFCNLRTKFESSGPINLIPGLSFCA